MEFEWDAAKAAENLEKHKVDFVEAVESFSDPNGFVLEDVKHSKDEERFFWVGKSASGRVLTTRFTRRERVIRIIGSAEWRDFRRLYDEKTKSKKSKA
ncbi:MAG: BrnT family toxin [Deltaproteobacteria bacterium]|nr:BrnT family toxin [Deltaproteobacteria bacterium]